MYIYARAVLVLCSRSYCARAVLALVPCSCCARAHIVLVLCSCRARARVVFVVVPCSFCVRARVVLVLLVGDFRVADTPMSVITAPVNPRAVMGGVSGSNRVLG